MGRLLLCAALLCLLTGVRSKPQYVLSTPAMFISGDTAQVCVNLLKTTERLDLTVVMEHNNKNTSIMAQNVEPDTHFQCSNFEVPSVSEAVPVAIIFSATGSSTDMRARQTVVISTVSDGCIYQMDKPIYKAGQNVLFRLFCLNSQLKIVDQKFTSVFLQDPSRIKIAQWLHPESDHGVSSFEFPLIPDAPSGTYMIIAERESGSPVRQWFTVDPYVLPRFIVEVNSPQSVSVTTESMKFNLSAAYTYGEPLAGNVAIRFCKHPQYYGRRQNCFKDKEGACADMTGVLDQDGSYNGVIDLFSPFMRFSRSSSFTMDITVTEEGTGIQVTESRYVSITSQPARLSFDYDSMKQNYKRGLDYVVAAKLTDESDKPMPYQKVEVQINYGEPQNAVTDSEGRLEHLVDTSNMVEANFTVRVSYTNPDQCYYAEWSEKDYPSVEYTVFRFYSYSGSFMQLKSPNGELSCDQSHSIDGEYIITPEGTGAGVKTVTVYYLVLSKSVIVDNGHKEIDLSSARNGSFSLDLPVSFEMAPSAELVAYVLLEDEMIADTVTLNIEKCFKNQVSMTFSEEKGTPGSKVEVQLSAAPNSYCALRVIDSSLTILNPYEQFSADRIYSSRRIYSYGYNVAGYDVEETAPPCEDPDKLIFYNGRYYYSTSSTTEGDSYKKLKSLGLLVGTPLRLRKPEVCDKNPPPPPIAVPLQRGGAEGFGGGANLKFASLEMDSAGGNGATTPVRKNFAETFLWIMVPTDTEGQATLSEKVPDTITKWQGTAFCTSEESGFGMTRYSSNYTTMLEFFVELSLPYSFVRDETLVLKGVVHNYLSQCVKVQVTLEDSNAFTAVPKNEQQDPCVCGNGKLSYTWEVQAKVIGELNFTVSAQATHTAQSCDGPFVASSTPLTDTVMQTTLVESEGVFKERTQSNLVFVRDEDVQLPVNINLPENIVSGSAAAHVTAVSDFVGLPLQNLKNMIQKPCGSGEQILARTAVIPHVINYLNATGQLDDKTYQEAKGSMSEGYYRQLAFAYGEGYRLFPNPGEKINSFVTAFTFKTLEEFGKHIYIDKDRQQQTLIWLEKTQNLETGCFRNQGELYTVEDSDREIFLTSYVAIALIEAEYSLAKTMLSGAMNCLKNATKTEQSIHNQALMLRAFTLANEHDHRDAMLQILMPKAKNEDGIIHWERDDMPKRPVVPFFWSPYPSAEVEITANMLLSMADTPNISQERLTIIAQICMWLVRQLDSYGNFRSTQDTIVGLQALTVTAQLLQSSIPSQQRLVVRKDNAEVATMDLSPDRRLLVHRASLPDASGNYNIAISGKGYCMIQTTVGYNIPIPKENSAFSLSLSTSSDNCINGVARKITVNGIVSYQGVNNQSSLALIMLRKFSGYNVDFASLNKLKEQKIISRYEENRKGQVVLYMKNLSQEPRNFSFDLLMGQRVLNMKTSSALVFNYYKDDENGYASYTHPCAVSSKGSS